MSNEGEVEIHSGVAAGGFGNCRQACVSIKILLFSGFLPFSSFSFPRKHFFKDEQLVQLKFSQHTVQTSGTKGGFLLFSFFPLHQFKKK